MAQAKFTIEQSHIDFLEQFKERGFKDKSEIVRLALDRLARELEREELTRSADLYAELYAEDIELQQITDAARIGWPQ
jgi:Arc/MetJ-type ribon-helix-helix transcriptional regulator